MARVLVLGSGQVGAFAARAIAKAGRDLVVADLDPAIGYFSRFGPEGDYPLEQLDVHDEAAVIALIKSYTVDTIVLSFGLSGAACVDDPQKAWETNVLGPRTVAQAALRTYVKRVIFVSSFAVYGRPAVDRLSESTPTTPESHYGRTKLLAEQTLTPLRRDGLDIRILRPCALFGPVRYGHGSHSARLIEALLIGGMRGLELKLQASDVSADEYLYVKDLGTAIAAASTIELETPDYVFNIGTGAKVGAEDLVAAVRHVVPDLRVRIEVTLPERERAMPPLDISRARRVLGFAPGHGFADALMDYALEAGFVQ